MEEILASIRRIIADDEAKPPAGDSRPAAAAPAPAPQAPVKPEKPAAPAKPALENIPPSKIPAAVAAAEKKVAPAPPPPAPAPSASNSQDDIDALLNGLDEATSAEEIRPSQPQSPPEPQPEPEAEPEVFELTDDMAVANVVHPEQPSFRKVDPSDDLEFTEVTAARTVNRPTAYEPPAYQAPPAFQAPPAGPMLSQTTVSAVESAFNTLAHTVLSNNARTLEDLVKEMLRPMLKSWLDDNLPGLVERIVKAEIERVSRGR